MLLFRNFNIFLKIQKNEKHIVNMRIKYLTFELNLDQCINLLLQHFEYIFPCIVIIFESLILGKCDIRFFNFFLHKYFTKTELHKKWANDSTWEVQILKKGNAQNIRQVHANTTYCRT